MKNAIIIFLSFLVIGMPVSYYWYKRQQKERLSHKYVSPPSDFKYRVNVKAAGMKGYLLCAPTTTEEAKLMIMDMAGNLIFRKDIDAMVYDFRQWRVEGKTYYTYGKNEFPHRPFSTFMASGPIVVLDSALNEIKELRLLPYDDVDTQSTCEFDLHDMVMLGSDHFINLVCYKKKVINIPASLNPHAGKEVYTAIVQERKNGKVVWQWDASHFPEFYLSSEEGNNFSDARPSDYTHANSLSVDPIDSNLVISFRGLNQIIKVSRKTGEVLWRLGGKNSDFPLTGTQIFLRQHAVKYIDNGKTLRFIDNGSNKLRPYSRVLEIGLDEKNKKLSGFKQYKVPHYFIATKGNVSQVGNNYLICGGEGNYILLTDPLTDQYLFEIRSKWGSYRAYMVDSLYGLEKKAAINQ